MQSLFISVLKTAQSGYATLVSVLLVGAVCGSIAALLLFAAVDGARVGTVTIQSNLAMSYANACTEEGLEQIRANTTFTGTNSLTFDRGACSYEVTNTGGSTRQVSATGTVSGVVRRTTITVNTLNPRIILTRWAETP